MSHMGIGHEPVAGPNACGGAFAYRTVEGTAFSDQIVVTYDQEAALAVILVVLGGAADHGAAPNLAVPADPAADLYDDVGFEFCSAVDDHVVLHDAVGANGYVVGDLRPVMDDRCWMYCRCHGLF